MELESVILSDVSQTQKRRFHTMSLTPEISKVLQVDLSTKEKQAHRRRTDLWVPRGGRVGRQGVGVWGENM